MSFLRPRLIDYFLELTIILHLSVGLVSGAEEDGEILLPFQWSSPCVISGNGSVEEPVVFTNVHSRGGAEWGEWLWATRDGFLPVDYHIYYPSNVTSEVVEFHVFVDSGGVERTNAITQRASVNTLPTARWQFVSDDAAPITGQFSKVRVGDKVRNFHDVVGSRDGVLLVQYEYTTVTTVLMAREWGMGSNSGPSFIGELLRIAIRRGLQYGPSESVTHVIARGPIEFNTQESTIDLPLTQTNNPTD